MSKPDVAILIIVLTDACSLGIALMWVTGQMKDEIEDTGPFNWISPGAQFSGIPSGAIVILCIFLIAAVFLTKGILWG